MRADAERPVVKRMAIGAYLGMPLGLVVLTTVERAASCGSRLGVAVLVAVVLLAMNVQLRPRAARPMRRPGSCPAC